jgi:hypothetical protein
MEFAFMEPAPSPQLLRQRIRNNIIAYLEVAASVEKQRIYERNVPIAQVPNEMINQWEDSVDSKDFDWYCAPVFSPEENMAMRQFHEVWNQVADETPNPMPYTIEALIGTEPWSRLMNAAQLALAVFERRGRFDSEVEERF